MQETSNEIVFNHNRQPSVKSLNQENLEPQKEEIPLIIHQSPFILGSKIVTILALSLVLYLALWIPSFFFAESSIALAPVLGPLYILIFVLLIFIDMFLIIYTILSWSRTYYVIEKAEVRIIYGIFSKNEKAFALMHAQEVTVHKGLLGNLFNFGTVEIFSPSLKDRVYLLNIANPDECVSVIKEKLVEKVAYQA